MCLVAELIVRDRDKLVQYASEVQPIMARYGGRIMGVSLGGARVLEGDWKPQLLVVHEWRSQADFNAFWESEEYQPVKRLRHEACDSRIVTFEGLPPPAQ
jgi:uncharacterized protein (DUF1330 family)